MRSRKKTLRLLLGTVLALACSTIPAVFGAEQTNSTILLAVDLVEGSRLVGTLLISSIPVHTSYASIQIPFHEIGGLRFGPKHETATVTLKNGDVLSVTFDVDALPLRTLFGDVTVGFQHIKRAIPLPSPQYGPADAKLEPPPPMSRATAIHARHILLATGNMTEARKARRREEAEEIRRELLNGANFAEMAKKRSDCPSKRKGGDLGTFRMGMMVPDFEAAAFNQKENEIGPVVETKFGYHIIQVLERN
ncbi:peptidylprolyl isomerase [Verrucomicrobiota bacterium]